MEGPEMRQTQRPPRRRGRCVRFFRGYLMLVGGGTTIYVLIRLLVVLLVEVQKWMTAGPIG